MQSFKILKDQVAGIQMMPVFELAEQQGVAVGAAFLPVEF